MNYYEHHLGDYAKDTGHLSMLEHGAYRILLDRYYSTEAGIPAAQAYRLARARSEEERQAVDVVLEEFFDLVEGVWINRRAEEEIGGAQARIEASKQNGKKGGRPRKNPAGSETETQQKPSGFSLGSETETQQKAHQAPSTKHHLPGEPKASEYLNGSCAHKQPLAAAADPPDPIHVRACELTALVRNRGTRLNASNPDVRSWAERGVTDAQLLTACDLAEERRAAKGDPSPVNAGLLTAILRDLTANAGGGARASPAARKANAVRDQNREAIERAKARIMAAEAGRDGMHDGEVIDAH